MSPSESFYMNNQATSLVELLKFLEAFQGVAVLLYFYNKIIIFELIKTKRQRLIYLIALGGENGAFMGKTLLFSQYANYDTLVLSILMAFAYVSCLMLMMIFLTCLFKLNTLNKQLI